MAVVVSSASKFRSENVSFLMCLMMVENSLTTLESLLFVYKISFSKRMKFSAVTWVKNDKSSCKFCMLFAIGLGKLNITFPVGSYMCNIVGIKVGT